MKKILLCSLLTLIACQSASADTFFGLYTGVNHWQTEYEGKTALQGTETALQDDLGIEDSGNMFAYIAVEHFIPLIPNIKLQYTKVGLDGRSVLERDLYIYYKHFPVNTPMKSEAVYDNYDVIAYYELLDNWLTLDLGLNIKTFDGYLYTRGEFAVAGENSKYLSIRYNFTKSIPMLYTKIQANIPFTGFYLGTEGCGITTGTKTVLDLKGYAGYESEFGLGAEIGFRSISLDVEQIDDMMADFSAKGFYGSINYHF